MNTANKKKNRRIFMIIMITACVIGFIAGLSAAILNDPDSGFSLNEIMASIKLYAYPVLSAVFLVFTVISGLVGCIGGELMYNKAKKSVAKSSESEEAFDLAEKSVDKLSILLNICLVSEAVFCMLMLMTIEADLIKNLGCLVGFAVFVPTFVMIVILTQKLFKLNKELNPNLDFDVMDINPAKTAEEQVDEMQRMYLYKAGFKAFKICYNTFTGAFIVLFLLSIVFKLGLLPCLIMGGAVIFMTVVLSVISYRMEHKVRIIL